MTYNYLDTIMADAGLVTPSASVTGTAPGADVLKNMFPAEQVAGSAVPVFIGRVEVAAENSMFLA